MVTFIEQKSSKIPKWNVNLLNRELGAEYLPTKLKELKTLDRAIRTKQNTLVGYAYYIPRNDQFLLLGSRFSGQIIQPCITGL